MDVPMAEVEISVSCKNLRDRDALSKSDPICVLMTSEFGGNKYSEADRTERIVNSLNPEFAHKFKLNYYFEEAQKLKFDIYDIDADTSKLKAHDFLGAVELTLGEIVGSSGSTVHRQLRGLSGHCGSIVISAEEVGASKEVVYMQFKGHKLDKKDFIGKSDPFLIIYRLNDDGSRTLAFRSEVVKNNLNPTWRQFKIPLRLLSGSNSASGSIQIQCYDYDNDGDTSHDLIGSLNTTFSQLSQGIGSLFDLINPQKQAKKKGYKNSGQLQLVRCEVRIEPTFLDYIRGGTQIHFTVAVDFTGSNGNPADPNSLHFINSNQPNQYMVALKAVGEICQDYDYDKMLPALGFGAKLPTGQVSHEFHLNFHPTDPHCHRVDGILQAYRQAILSCQLYGPTNFSPVINHVARIAAGSGKGLHYFVLLIITDGIISDFDQTIASIVAASSLPMSIIIVGVGNEDFQAMEVLDADKQRLSAGGRFAERDIVQFVPLCDFTGGKDWFKSQAKLAKKVLKEVPNQMVEWMQTRGIQPQPPKHVDATQLHPQNVPGQVPPGQGPPQGQHLPGQGQPHGQYPPSQGQPQHPPGQVPPQGQYPPGQGPPQGQYLPGQGASEYPTGQGPTQGQHLPGQGQPKGQYPPSQGQPQHSSGQVPPQGQYPPGQGPPQGQYPAGQGPPQGQYLPGQGASQYPPGQVPPQYPPGQVQPQYPPGQVPPQYPPGQVPPQYPPGQVPPQYPPGQVPPQYLPGQLAPQAQYPPGQGTPQQYIQGQSPAQYVPGQGPHVQYAQGQPQYAGCQGYPAQMPYGQVPQNQYQSGYQGNQGTTYQGK